MKKGILLLTALTSLGLSNLVTAQVPNYVPADGLVAYYPFSGNANDVSGNGNNGTVNGASLTADRFGNGSSAYAFNGSSSYINCDNTPSISNPVNFTFSAWINPTSVANNAVGTAIKVILSKYDGLYNGYILGIFDGQGEIRLHNPQKKSFEFARSNNLSTNTWVHLIAIKDGVSLKIYLNNILIQTTDISSYNPSMISSSSLSIGRASWNPTINAGGYFNGKIDDIGIWNRALTEQEIKNLYDANICYQNITVTDTLIINIGLLSVNPVTYKNTITISPNPAKDHIVIDCGNIANITGYQIKINNSLGQEVFATVTNQQQFTVPLQNWGGTGLYFVNIVDAQGHTIDIKKIILE